MTNESVTESEPSSLGPVAHLVDEHAAELVDVLGPTVRFLTADRGDDDMGDDAPSVMRGTILPGGTVPLHRHADPETYLPSSGEVEALVESVEGLHWIRVGPGDIFHVPGNAKHAFRNTSNQPAVMIIVSTVRIARFFREIGTRADASSPATSRLSEAAARHFLETSARYGYWNASPEENAAVGIDVPGQPS